MSAGTLTLTNNSASVVGNGSSFTTELTAADFIVVTVGGVSYTLPVKTVDSTTALTLVSNYTGPTQSGAAWYAVPRVAMNLVTAALVAQSAEALRGLNYDKQNWQQIFSGTGTATIKLPDGSAFTGPTWNSFTTALNSKADKVDGAVPLSQGGTGAPTVAGARTNLGLGDSAVRNVGTAAGTVAAGDDSRIVNSLRKDQAGTMSQPIYSNFLSANGFMLEKNSTAVSQSGSNYYNRFARVFSRFSDASFEIDHFESPGNYYAARIIVYSSYQNSQLASFEMRHTGIGVSQGGWQTFSDRRIKTNLVPVEKPLEKMKLIRGYTWDRLDSAPSGRGFIAQEVAKAFPEAVSVGGSATLKTGEKIDDILTPDTYGVAAALHHEAILALMEKIEALTTRVDKIEGGSVTIHPGS